MNMADHERQKALRGDNFQEVQSVPGIFKTLNPFEQLSSELERNGYFPKLSKIPRAWQCTLFLDGGKNETPPSGRGETALDALLAAAGQIKGRN